MYGTASGSATGLTAEDLYRLGITASAAVGTRLLSRPGGLGPLEDQALRALIDGVIRPVIGQALPLAEAALAHQRIEARQTIGKTVLHIAESATPSRPGSVRRNLGVGKLSAGGLLA